MNWSQVLEVVARAIAEQEDERRVLLVLPDASYHIKEILDPEGEGSLLGFVVFADDPLLSKRTDETLLLFVRPEQVQRLVVRGLDPTSGQLGFGP